MHQTRRSQSVSDLTEPTAWLEVYGDALFGYAMARVRNRETAEDLLQDTLLTGFARLDDFAGRSSLLTWLIGILRNKLREHYRESARDPQSLELAEAVVEDEFRRGKWRNAPGAWPRGDPESGLETEEFRRVLAECFAKLPRRAADMLIAAEHADGCGEQLGRQFEASVGNVFVILYRARTALRGCLERHWFGGDAGEGC